MVTRMAIDRGGVVVGVIAVDHVRGHVLVEEPRHGLNAKEASNKASHHDEAGALVVPTGILEVAF